MAECPVCGVEITLSGDVEEGEIIICEDCGSELEVTGKDSVQEAPQEEEDWGEYGTQKIVATTRPEKNRDISAFRYLAFRVRTDKDMELVVTLVTRPDSLPRTEESHFTFTGYTQLKAGDWKYFVLDLAKLELSAEGDKAYAAAGKPTRSNRLTSLRWITNKKNQTAQVDLDDITFHGTLPKSLADKVQAP